MNALFCNVYVSADMVTKFHKCVSLYALYARSGSVNWCKASCSLAVARLSSAACDTEHLRPHLPTSKRTCFVFASWYLLLPIAM